MRLGVLDVGSNTVHLLVVDAHLGAHPWPAHSEKSVLRLSEQIKPDGRLSREGADALVSAVKEARRSTERLQTDDLLAFATSAVREATNSAEVLARVRDEAGIELRVLSGEGEARMTFLAVRRWLELAAGIDEEPDLALSVPLGAGRLTRERLHGDPPSSKEIDALIEYAQKTIEKPARALLAAGWDCPVATSKTLRTLARLSGAAPSDRGPLVQRELTLTGLHQVRTFIQHIPSAKLAEMDGVSASRAHQLLAGAIVAEVTMERLGIEAVRFCPWALREGVILRRLDILES